MRVFSECLKLNTQEPFSEAIIGRDERGDIRVMPHQENYSILEREASSCRRLLLTMALISKVREMTQMGCWRRT